MKITCDLHIHSALSPCAENDMTPNNIVNMSLLCGLDAIAITDHNTCGNVRAVMEVAKRKKADFAVVPGMEIQTREDVHVIALFSSLEDAYAMQEAVFCALPHQKASEKQTLKQLIMDENDEIRGYCDRLLNMSAELSVNEVFKLVREYNGTAFPAHIDRKSMSIISSLGFIPPKTDIRALEISMYAQKKEYEAAYPGHRILTNSDAHELGNVGICCNVLEADDISPKGIVDALNRIS